MSICWLFKRQAHKMVKHIPTIRWLMRMNCLIVFDHFVGLALGEEQLQS